MNNAELALKLISMVPSERIDDLIDLSTEVSKPMQKEIAKHLQNIVKESILAKTEVRDDKL